MKRLRCVDNCSITQTRPTSPHLFAEPLPAVDKPRQGGVLDEVANSNCQQTLGGNIPNFLQDAISGLLRFARMTLKRIRNRNGYSSSFSKPSVQKSSCPKHSILKEFGYMRGSILFLMGIILVACARSPNTNFYVLNPLPHQAVFVKRFENMRIGIDEINIPGYLSKPQFMIYNAENRIEFKEFDQWAEDLDKNIRDVIQTNLSVLLPGSVVASRPWNVNFNPNYQLQVNILEFSVDTNGNSKLRVNYMIYYGDVLTKKGTLSYVKKVARVTVDSLVVSMNANLDNMTKDIAKALR